ncbi:hypothetical protein BLOT_009831 [Blomia tropicalis]|nr:hypothetical protein BLOT_009831 [Blomia tropicalis]
MRGKSPLIIDCQSGLSTPKSIGSIKHYQNDTTVPNELRYNQINHWPKKFGIKENTKIQIRNRCKFPYCDKLSPYNITDITNINITVTNVVWLYEIDIDLNRLENLTFDQKDGKMGLNIIRITTNIESFHKVLKQIGFN